MRLRADDRKTIQWAKQVLVVQYPVPGPVVRTPNGTATESDRNPSSDYVDGSGQNDPGALRALIRKNAVRELESRLLAYLKKGRREPAWLQLAQFPNEEREPLRALSVDGILVDIKADEWRFDYRGSPYRPLYFQRLRLRARILEPKTLRPMWQAFCEYPAPYEEWRQPWEKITAAGGGGVNAMVEHAVTYCWRELHAVLEPPVESTIAVPVHEKVPEAVPFLPGVEVH